ncbi:MAG: hypothetical protein AAF528_00165 [Cyanobacteria bacterium P01_C01_bin.121]
MKLTARKKHSSTKPIEKDASQRAETQPTQTVDESDTLTQILQIRCNTLLYTTLQNMIASMHTAGDYSYTSVADVIRAAIQAYKDGAELTEQVEPGSKKATTIRVNDELYGFYESWPKRMRSTILERVIRNFIKGL